MSKKDENISKIIKIEYNSSNSSDNEDRGTFEYRLHTKNNIEFNTDDIEGVKKLTILIIKVANKEIQDNKVVYKAIVKVFNLIK